MSCWSFHVRSPRGSRGSYLPRKVACVLRVPLDPLRSRSLVVASSLGQRSVARRSFVVRSSRHRHRIVQHPVKLGRPPVSGRDLVRLWVCSSRLRVEARACRARAGGVPSACVSGCPSRAASLGRVSPDTGVPLDLMESRWNRSLVVCRPRRRGTGRSEVRAAVFCTNALYVPLILNVRSTRRPYTVSVPRVLHVHRTAS